MRRQISLAFLLVLIGAVVYGQQKDLYESFEGAWTGGVPAPLGWSQQIVSGSLGWGQATMPFTGPGTPKGGAADHKYAAAVFPSGVAGTTAILVTPEFDFTQEDSVRLNFRYVNISGTDTLRVRISTDGGSTWVTAASYGRTVDTTGGWQKVHLRLDALAGKSNVRIGFEGTADEGSSDIWLDRVVIQYPFVSIREIQEVSADSLLVADNLQRSNNNRWSLQRSWYYTDTLTVEGVVVVPALIVRFTSAGRNLLLSDTTSPDTWGGLFIRANLSSTSPDTVLADDWGVQNVEPGDYVRLRAFIDEFPSADMVSQTQAVPLYNPRIEILGSAPVPPHRPMTAADFYQGGFPGGSIRFSTGEPYEFMRVELTNLTVVGSVNLTNGTFAMQDAAGNQISTMDASKWFTTRGHRDPASTWALPPTFAAIDTIRGYIMANSGQEAARGYRIAPLYPGDVVVGAIRPQISTHRRNPVVVPPDSTPRISARVTQLPGGAGVKDVNLHVSLDNGPFISAPMSLVDTVYQASIPAQPAGTGVRYFITATDSAANTVTLASSALDGSALDTLKGFFFYTVLSGPITIQDVQYTPFPNGRTPYLGGEVALTGIVTGDTTNVRSSPISTVGTSTWYIQSGSAPWSGIWVAGPDSILAGLRLGDSVTVTGTVQENFDVTRLFVSTTPAVVHATGRPLPAPVTLLTSSFSTGVGNGSISAEPYEGMLVTFRDVVVTNTAPTFADPTEYEVGSGDGSQPIIVRRDGKNTYTNLPADTVGYPEVTLLRLGDRLSSLTGIIYYSSRRYNIVPRGNTDFGTVTTDIEILRTDDLPPSFVLEQNFPNPFNPTTSIRYQVAAQGAGAVDVRLVVFDMLGREVAVLVQERQMPGHYEVRFAAERLPSGVYFYRLQAGSQMLVRKMLLLK